MGEPFRDGIEFHIKDCVNLMDYTAFLEVDEIKRVRDFLNYYLNTTQ